MDDELLELLNEIEARCKEVVPASTNVHRLIKEDVPYLISRIRSLDSYQKWASCRLCDWGILLRRVIADMGGSQDETLLIDIREALK